MASPLKLLVNNRRYRSITENGILVKTPVLQHDDKEKYTYHSSNLSCPSMDSGQRKRIHGLGTAGWHNCIIFARREMRSVLKVSSLYMSLQLVTITQGPYFLPPNMLHGFRAGLAARSRPHSDRNVGISIA